MYMYGNYFKFKDLVDTETGLPNDVTSVCHLVNLAHLWNILNFLREKLKRPIFVNSAFRTSQVNKQVGGSKRSYHMQGRAADIRCEPCHMEELWKIIEQYDAEFGLSEKIKHSTYYHIAF